MDTVSRQETSFVIEGLNTGVEYEVSVIAMNENGETSGAVTGNTTTETNGKYQKHLIFSLCDVRASRKVSNFYIIPVKLEHNFQITIMY
jgi:hypothetical protein